MVNNLKNNIWTKYCSEFGKHEKKNCLVHFLQRFQKTENFFHQFFLQFPFIRKFIEDSVNTYCIYMHCLLFRLI